MKFLFAGTGAAIVGAILAFILTLLWSPNTLLEFAENSQSKSKESQVIQFNKQENSGNIKNSPISSNNQGTINNTYNSNDTNIQNDFRGAKINNLNSGSGNSTVIINKDK